MTRTSETDGRVAFSNLTARLAAAIVGTTATLLLLAGRAAVAQPIKTVWDGVFTAEQAARGQSSYPKACGSCHGTGLEGDGFAPPLIGESFTDRWQAGSVGDFLLIVKTTMPQDRPGSLSADAYADIVAYVLKMNNYPAGPNELSRDPDQYKNVTFSRLAGGRIPEPQTRRASKQSAHDAAVFGEQLAGHDQRRALPGVPAADSSKFQRSPCGA
jgi:mono/diheme cytochrome c family protein